MFNSRRFKLRGEVFDQAMHNLSDTAHMNYSTLQRHADHMYPLRWEDKLTADQEHYFHFITEDDRWQDVASWFHVHLAKAPVLSLARMFENDDRRGELLYIGIGTLEGAVAIFSLRSLSIFRGAMRKADLLPDDVRDWLASDRFYVITSGLSHYFDDDVHGFNIVKHIDMDSVYSHYYNVSVITSAMRGEGDIRWQLTYAQAYHHRSSTPSACKTLVGRNGYTVWPPYRKGAFPFKTVRGEPTSQEKWFLYYEGLAPHIFVNRLLQHGVVFGEMPQVRAELPICSLYQVFLGGGTCPNPAAASSTQDNSDKNLTPSTLETKRRLNEPLAAKLKAKKPKVNRKYKPTSNVKSRLGPVVEKQAEENSSQATTSGPPQAADLARQEVATTARVDPEDRTPPRLVIDEPYSPSRSYKGTEEDELVLNDPQLEKEFPDNRSSTGSSAEAMETEDSPAREGEEQTPMETPPVEGSARDLREKLNAAASPPVLDLRAKLSRKGGLDVRQVTVDTSKGQYTIHLTFGKKKSTSHATSTPANSKSPTTLEETATGARGGWGTTRPTTAPAEGPPSAAAAASSTQFPTTVRLGTPEGHGDLEEGELDTSGEVAMTIQDVRVKRQLGALARQLWQRTRQWWRRFQPRHQIATLNLFRS